MKVIGVDTGNAMIKTANFAFTSGITSSGSTRPAVEGETIFYNGNYYSLSDERVPYTYDKTEDDRFFILMLFAVAKEIMREHKNGRPLTEGIYEDVVLGMGLPPSHLQRLRDKYLPFFSNNGREIEFVYNEQPFTINVVDVKVYPQGVAAVANKLSEFATSPVVYIIDIGGFTTDIVTLHKGKLAPGRCYSDDRVGIIQLYNTISQKVRDRFNGNISDIQIEAILRNNDDSLPQQIIDFVNEVAQEYAVDMLRQFKEKGLDFTFTPAYFIGGGSKLLKRFFLPAFAERGMMKPVFVKSPNANAAGFEALASLSSNL